MCSGTHQKDIHGYPYFMQNVVPKCNRGTSCSLFHSLNKTHTGMTKTPFPYQDTNIKTDREMNSFFHCQDTNTMQTGITKKNVFPFPGYQYKNADREIKSFFHCQDTNTTQTGITNKNVFPFPGYQYKNADMKSIHFSIARIPIQRRQE
jgi:hypothetical protein